jgi:6-phosphogluconolactonase (cycloisomerase 2 family)
MGDIMKNVLTFILLALVYSQAFAGYTGPNPNFNSVGIDTTLRADELGSAPTTPAANSWKLYFKSSGPYVIDDVGTETGLFDFVPDSRTITTTAPLLIDGGASADLSANRTLSIPVATSLVDGYLDNADWTTFNGKQDALVNSAGLASAINDETGTGVAVFSASPALTGNPTAPTQAPNDNSTKIATTAYVDAAVVGGTIAESYAYQGGIFPYFKNDETVLGLNEWFYDTQGAVATGLGQSSDGTYVAMFGGSSSLYIRVLKLVSGVYRTISVPSTQPTGAARSAEFSPNGDFLAVAHSTSPYITIYERSGDTFTKLSDPATLPTGTGASVAWDSTSTYLAIAHATSPFVTVYERSGSTFTKLSDPATLPTGTGGGVSWGTFSGTDYLAVAHNTSPFVSIYSRSGSTLTKISNPATLPTGNAGTHGAVAYSSDGAWLTVAHETSPFLTVYEISAGPTYTKISNPASLPGNTCTSANWKDDTTYLTLTCGADDTSITYYRSGSTLTKLTDPTTLFSSSSITSMDGTSVFSKRDQNYIITTAQYLPPQLYSYTSSAMSNYNHSSDFSEYASYTPAGSVNDIQASLDGKIVAVAHNTSPFMSVYSSSGGVLEKLTDPATTPTGNGQSISIHPSGKFVAVAHTTSPFVSIYSLYGRTLTKITNPVTLPTGTGSAVSFSNSGGFLAVGHATSRFITVYQKSGSTFTKIADPGTLPSSTVNSLAWTYDDQYLVVQTSTSPYVIVYQRSGTTLTKLTDPVVLPSNDSVANTHIAVSPDSNKFIFQTSLAGSGAKLIVYSISGSTVTAEYSANQNNIFFNSGVNAVSYWGNNDIVGMCYNNNLTVNPTLVSYFKYNGASGFTPFKTSIIPTEVDCREESFFSLDGGTIYADNTTDFYVIENLNKPTGTPEIVRTYGRGMK